MAITFEAIWGLESKAAHVTFLIKTESIKGWHLAKAVSLSQALAQAGPLSIMVFHAQTPTSVPMDSRILKEIKILFIMFIVKLCSRDPNQWDPFQLIWFEVVCSVWGADRFE